jgi:NTE family protein
MPQRVNVVFQGGGVKGIAFAGALTALEKLPGPKNAIIIDSVGGVSVGAITAVLYAAGYTADELTAALKEKSIASLLPESPPWNRIHSAWRLWRKRGLYSTAEIAAWVEGLLKKKGVQKFEDLRRVKECKIVAANVTSGKYETYSKEKNAGDDVVLAVVKSLSIPLFFTPYADGELRLYVDGGLLSNYPLWLFRDSPLVTVGLRLGDKPATGATGESGLFDYLKSLLATMLSAHDQAGLGKPPNVAEVMIDASFVSSTEFRLEEEEQDRLFERGRLAVAEFDWGSLPPTREVVFDDPEAGAVLEATANSIEKLFNRSSKNRRQYNKYEIKYFVDEKGWTTTQWHYVLTNRGPGPISMLRYDYQYAVPQRRSFNDLKLVISVQPVPRDPRVNPSQADAVILPIENSKLAMSFALAFIPPIEPGQTREVTIKFEALDFEKLMRRERDLLEIELAHEEGMEQASVTLEIPRRIGQLQLSNDRGKTPAAESRPVQSEDRCGYVWSFQNLTQPLHLKVDLTLQ